MTSRVYRSTALTGSPILVCYAGDKLRVKTLSDLYRVRAEITAFLQAEETAPRPISDLEFCEYFAEMLGEEAL